MIATLTKTRVLTIRKIYGYSTTAVIIQLFISGVEDD